MLIFSLTLTEGERFQSKALRETKCSLNYCMYHSVNGHGPSERTHDTDAPSQRL
jgi:hypothetical protein